MQAYQILANNKLTPHFTDIGFRNEELIAACSQEQGERKLYKGIALMMEDNGIDQNNLENCIIDTDTVRAIAYSTDVLYTNYGLDVHSWQMKNIAPFNTLKVVKIIKP